MAKPLAVATLVAQPALVLSPEETALPARPIQVAAKATQAVVAINHAVTATTAGLAQAQRLAHRMTLMRNPPSILKTISNPVPMPIWARKAA